jgi:hypothetical protein
LQLGTHLVLFLKENVGEAFLLLCPPG